MSWECVKHEQHGENGVCYDCAIEREIEITRLRTALEMIGCQRPKVTLNSDGKFTSEACSTISMCLVCAALK